MGVMTSRIVHCTSPLDRVGQEPQGPVLCGQEDWVSISLFSNPLNKNKQLTGAVQTFFLPGVGNLRLCIFTEMIAERGDIGQNNFPTC